MLRNEQRLGSRMINRAAEELAARFNAERIALAITSALRGTELSILREKLASVRDRTAGALPALHLPQMPGRGELLAEAKAMFAKTRSLDDIVDRAHEILAAAVGVNLLAHAEGRT